MNNDNLVLKIRPMEGTEYLYSYTQSPQIMGQTGCIGHLEASVCDEGSGFFWDWEDHRQYLKTDEFIDEFQDVISTLRFDESYEKLLGSPEEMKEYCEEYWDSDLENGYYGFRVDTQKYSYLIRVDPDISDGEKNVFCYAYRQNWLNEHMQNATKGIRFVDNRYNDLFRIPDGGRIEITSSNGRRKTEVCRYVDDYHMEYGNHTRVYHICEFYERMRDYNMSVRPIDNYVKQKNRGGEER